MKKTIIVLSVLFIVIILTATVVQADPPVKFDDKGNEVEWKKEGRCTRIQDGALTYSPGHYLYGTPLTLGYDPYGYNYQGHIFNGTYANVYLGGAGYTPYDGDDEAYLDENPGAASHWAWPWRNVELSMKWNDAWIANTDCDDDGLLDRHYGSDSYIGSDAWLTNHMAGSEDDGSCHWTYFTKIVAAPADATEVDNTWYNSASVEIGPEIWGAFATIQTVENDPCLGINGAQYVSPDHPGFGGW